MRVGFAEGPQLALEFLCHQHLDLFHFVCDFLSEFVVFHGIKGMHERELLIPREKKAMDRSFGEHVIDENEVVIVIYHS